MSTMILCSVFDSKAGRYAHPVSFPSVPFAVRAFTDAVVTDKILSSHPEDYSLVLVGSFDEETSLVQSAAREVLITGIEARSRFEQQQYVFKSASFLASDKTKESNDVSG